jgi:competence protein ComEC
MRQTSKDQLSMRKAASCFSAIALSVCLVWLSCSRTSDNLSQGYFTFAVLDVGQGLAQIGMRDNRAVAWDMGDSAGFGGWEDGYRALESVQLSAIVISHAHRDHWGGLRLLPSATDFTGLVVVSPYTDTALLRDSLGLWSQRIRFKTVSQGDTLALLDGVSIECLWPASRTGALAAVDSTDPNHYSLCFKVSFGATSILVTSDIDSAAETGLNISCGERLRSDAVVVPHHGSAGSLNVAFYGYVAPQSAVVSCGINNPYGHPAESVMKFLGVQQGIAMYDTRFNGHVIGLSNGDYWQWNLRQLSTIFP